MTKTILSLRVASVMFLGLVISYSNARVHIKEYRALVKDFIRDVKDPTGFIDWYLLDLIPVLLGSEPSNVNGSFNEYKELLEKDKSNENLAAATVLDMIENAGFQYHEYYVVSDDGYLNQLIHIINPLADKSKLKKPPVILFHGGLVDPSLYVWASNKQHHPERWPHQPENGPITSSNRSLAFMLSNNGYDVWLAGSRGSNRENQHKNRIVALEELNDELKNSSYPKAKNETYGEQIGRLLRIPAYWSYNMDDITINEFPRQIERVMNLTGHQKLSVLVYSFSTMTSLQYLSMKPEIAKHFQNFITVAPIINIRHSNLVFNTFCRRYTFDVPEPLGEFLNRRIFLTPYTRMLVRMVNRDSKLRYTLLKLLTVVSAGSSAKYRTFLEPAVTGHLLMETSFREMRHFCQQVLAGRLQKYDLGFIGNLFTYGHFRPPVYDLSRIGHLDNWMILSASQDNASPPSSIRQIVKEIGSEPKENIQVVGYNHVDLFAGVDNDIMVNKPIMSFLDNNTLS